MKSADSEVGTGRTELTTEIRVGMRPMPVGISIVWVLVSNVVLLATSVEVSGTAELTGPVESEVTGDEVEADEDVVGSSGVEGEELRGVLVSISTMVLLAEDGAGGSRPPIMELIGSKILSPVVAGAVCCEVWAVS